MTTALLGAAFLVAGVLWVLVPLFRPLDRAWRAAEETRWFGPPGEGQRARILLSLDAREDHATGKLDDADYARLLRDAEGEEGPEGER